MEEAAYKVIQETQPTMLEAIKDLLDKGQTPRQIGDFVARRDVALAGLVEMAANHMKKEATP